MSKYVIDDDVRALLVDALQKFHRCGVKLNKKRINRLLDRIRPEEVVHKRYDYRVALNNRLYKKAIYAEWDVTEQHFEIICSNCAQGAERMSKYCPNCGAQMQDVRFRIGW